MLIYVNINIFNTEQNHDYQLYTFLLDRSSRWGYKLKHIQRISSTLPALLLHSLQYLHSGSARTHKDEHH